MQLRPEDYYNGKVMTKDDQQSRSFSNRFSSKESRKWISREKANVSAQSGQRAEGV